MPDDYQEITRFDRTDPTDPHGDNLTLEQLAAAGSDLTIVTSFIHYLTFDAESQMLAAGRAIRQALGYSVRGFAPENADEGWSLHVTIKRLPSLENVQRMREVMAVAADRFGGSYDGWEAAVRRR